MFPGRAPEHLSEWLTRGETAELANVSERTVDRDIHAGQLRAEKAPNGSVRIHRSWAIAWSAARDGAHRLAVGVIVIGDGSKIVAACDEFEAILGYEPGGMAGQPDPAIPGKQLDGYRAMLKATGQAAGTVLLARRDGGTASFTFSARYVGAFVVAIGHVVLMAG